MSDMSDLRTIAKTKVRRACAECEKTIEIGSCAIRRFTVDGNDHFEAFSHIECDDAGQAYAHMTDNWGDDYWHLWELNEGEDLMWLLNHHPMAADRVGAPQRVMRWAMERRRL